jgi:hypothetical protein
MKKISILITLYLITLTTFGQKRQCDLKVVIPDSIKNDSFFSPSNYESIFYVINQGPDSIKKDDLIGVRVFLAEIIFEFTFPKFSQDIGVGDTAIFKRILNLNFPTSKNNIDYCVYAELGIMANGQHFIPENSTQKIDNKYCIKVNHVSRITNTINVNENEISSIVYPNTFINDFFVSNVTLNDQISIIDILGQKVNFEYNINSNIANIKTQVFNSGIYFVVIKRKSGELNCFKIIKAN